VNRTGYPNRDRGSYRKPRRFRKIVTAPIQPITVSTPGAGSFVVGTGEGGWVGGDEGGGGRVVITSTGSVVTIVVTGRVTGDLVVAGTGTVVCTGTTVAADRDEVIRGLMPWISRLPGRYNGCS